jgi:DtxR family Mn-dependent transcriptional regulator
MLGKKIKIPLSRQEEDYLKTIFQLGKNDALVSTTELARALKTKPASVTEMLKRLFDKGYVHYQPYQGVRLTEEGKLIAIYLIRKHRIWETFLVNVLHFSWDQVHEIADQLEHVKSPELIERLDEFLGFPEIDPHGEPIPDKDGKIPELKMHSLSKAPEGKQYKIIRILDPSPEYFEYLNSISLQLGEIIFLEKRYQFDNSVQIKKGNATILLSKKASRNLLVQEIADL